MTNKVVRKPSITMHYTLFTLYLIPSALIFATGLVLCLTIVGIAPGAALIVASGIPIAAESNRYIKRKLAWDKVQKNGGPEKFRTGRGKSNVVLVKLGEGIDYEYDPALDIMVPIQKPWVQ
jgi:hypothetical protein